MSYQSLMSSNFDYYLHQSQILNLHQGYHLHYWKMNDQLSYQRLFYLFYYDTIFIYHLFHLIDHLKFNDQVMNVLITLLNLMIFFYFLFYVLTFSYYQQLMITFASELLELNLLQALLIASYHHFVAYFDIVAKVFIILVLSVYFNIIATVLNY